MELYLNREIESYNDKEFPLEAIYSMCQQTNKWSEDTTNIETKSETQTAPPYGKFSMHTVIFEFSKINFTFQSL